MAGTVPEWRQGDNWKPITGTVTDGTGAAVDIHLFTSIRFVALQQPGTTVITGTTVIVDDGTVGLRGKWSYTWGATDLSVTGSYEVMIETTQSGGKIESYPSNKANAPTFLVTADND